MHRRVLQEVLEFAQAQGFGLCGLLRSPLLGPKGNVEFLAWLVLGAPPAATLAEMIEETLPIRE